MKIVYEFAERWYDLRDRYLSKLNKFMIQSFQASVISLSLAWACAMWMYLLSPLTPPLPYEGLPLFLQGWISYLVVGYWYCFFIMKASATFLLITVICLIYVIGVFPIITNHMSCPGNWRNYEIPQI